MWLLPDDLDLLARHPQDNESLIQWYKDLGFKRLLDEQERFAATADTPHTAESDITPSADVKHTSLDYQCITTTDALKTWIHQLQDAGCFAIDTETTGLDYMTADLVGISWSTQSHQAAYLPLQHQPEAAPTQVDLQEALALLKPILEDPQVIKIGQNIKYDQSIFAKYGITLQGIRFDTMLLSYVYNSVATRHNMDALALKYLGHHTTSFESIAGKGAKQKTFDAVELATATHYACEDADITYRLYQYLWPLIQADPQLLFVYEDIEVPLISILSGMERRGVFIDEHKLKQQGQTISLQIERLEQQAFDIAGEVFNLSSPKQLQAIFFDKLHYPVLKKTPKGAPSTAEEVWKSLRWIIHCRKLSCNIVVYLNYKIHILKNCLT